MKSRESYLSSRKSHLTQESCLDPRPLVNISLDSYDSDESELFNMRKIDITNHARARQPKKEPKETQFYKTVFEKEDAYSAQNCPSYQTTAPSSPTLNKRPRGLNFMSSDQSDGENNDGKLPRKDGKDKNKNCTCSISLIFNCFQPLGGRS